ncbi:MAG: isoleucine--tRNA ligase [Chloroflexi bacterium]|nr:isoleucine--tRNA ligase [Chloroflexota bacterium]
MFEPVSSRVNFPEIEERILSFWKERGILQKSTRLRNGAPQFTLYDGPPTVNGNPGIHHILSRVYKDVIPRYKTMKGFCVFRKAGWDTHGLPVELEVEKNLGFTNKSQIEEYGIAEFNARCRESVMRYLKTWEDLTDRIGFWLDMEHPYITFDNGYVESLWWIIKQLWDKDLIYQGYRVTPHCPRCGTSLSSHEVALGYDETEDPSVFIKFEWDRSQGVVPSSLTDPDSQVATYFLAWTTTPWTLPGNTALAVDPNADYALVEYDTGQGARERLILAEALLWAALEGQYRVLKTVPGKDLVGCQYKPLFNPGDYNVPVQHFAPFDASGKNNLLPSKAPETYPVIAGDFVSMEDGTGIVHIAPAFGPDDFEAGQQNNLYFVEEYVNLQGRIAGDYPFSGKFVKEADPLITSDLESRGLLYRSGKISHTYPFCWRCSTPLLYYAKPSWYIKTTALKDELVSGNEQINWYPEYIKYGRFGDWLENNVDWAFSRERYWGTPLPVWRCEQCTDRFEAIGSIDELRTRPGLQGLVEPIDLHRPFVDQITFLCPACGGTMKRVPEVLDAWLDSGAMPVAQFHYPFENQDQFEASFPADYICEAVDQTRGWFYTLHALSTLLFQRPCFENVICLGHILDAQGEKMSKAKGNVVDPWEIISDYGADALRWYMFTSSPSGNVKRFDARQVKEVTRKFLSTLWNTYSFFVLYANIDNFNPTKFQAPSSSAELDRWIDSELNQLILQVTEDFENYNPTDAGRRIEEFVERLSNWYVRRSRRRFWKSENDTDKLSAYFTLYECLITLSKLMAPLAPFVAEEIYQNLVRSVAPESEESVHLCNFPSPDPTKIDDRLAAETRLAMKVSSMGRAARSKAGIKVRQPLAKVIIKTSSRSERAGLERLASQVLEELNAKSMEFVEAATDLVDKPGYAVATEGDYLIALSTEIPDELIKEGLAREVVHRLQTMRRNAGFDIADHIDTYYQADPPLQQAIEHLSAYIKQETLSRELICQSPHEGIHSEQFRIHGHSITLGVARIDTN